MLIVLTMGVQAQAQVSGISYTFSPIGQRVFFDDAAALDGGFLYGGELGFGFGKYVELSAVYLTGSNFSTDFSGIAGDSLSGLVALPGRDVDVRRYGGRLRLNLGRGRFVPFLIMGTGIVRFNPEGLDTSERIYAEGGAGVTFRVAQRYTVSLAAEGLGYRYYPGSALMTDADIASAGITRGHFGQRSVFNPTLAASLKIYLGGRNESGLTGVDRALLSNLSGDGFRLAVEPFYGQISFNSALGFPDNQRVAGLNLGFELGPYLGLKGFYWQGTDRDTPTDFQHLRLYGGELDFRFQQAIGGRITPYLTFGGGYVDVDGDAYTRETGFGPNSRYFATAGGGVRVPFLSGVNVHAGIRSLIMSKDDISAVSEPGSLYGSYMYTAGISFNIGRGRSTPSKNVQTETPDQTESEGRSDTLERRLAWMQARLDSLESARVPAGTESNMAMTYGQIGPDRPYPADSLGTIRALRSDSVVFEPQRRSNLSGQFVTIPVPEEGEIYIRYGSSANDPIQTTVAPPLYVGTSPEMSTPVKLSTEVTPVAADSVARMLTLEQIRQIVRQAVSEQSQPRQGLSAQELESSLTRMEARMEERLALETTRLRRELTGTVDTRNQVAAEIDSAEAVEDPIEYGKRRFSAVFPETGIRFGEKMTQMLVGVRGEFRYANRGYRFIPELSLGLGDKVTVNIYGNLAWDILRVGSFHPYAGAGLGFISKSGLSGLELVINMIAGAEYTTGGGTRLFAEYGTQDFFNLNRILVGYRVSF